MYAGLHGEWCRLQQMYTYPTNGTKIRSHDAEFDAAGYLLLTDYTNKEVHIANAATGTLLRK